MSNWTKLSRTTTNAGRAPRTAFGVSRNRAGSRNASFIIPKGQYTGEARADVYSDGNGRLAFRLHGKGEFAVRNKTGAPRVAIPVTMAERIPYGTHDVSVTRDGDMYVLDLSQIDMGA